MRVIFESKDLPPELRDLISNQRVTATITFNVDFIQIETGEEDFSDRVGGSVTSFQITNKTGGGGLDPVVERGIRKLKTLTMGTNG